MKKMISLLLVLALFCSLGITAFATGFDASKLTSSTHYYRDSSTNGWKVVSSFIKEYSNVDVNLAVFLSATYIEKGWGPDLRVKFYDKTNSNYDKIDGLRITVNDKIYSFANFEMGEQYGVVYGGEVMRALLNSLSSAVYIAIEIDHTTKDGSSYTATIDPVSVREMRDIADLGPLFEAANLWDQEVTKDLLINDSIYNAAIYDNTSFDYNAAKSASVDWTDLIGYWTSNSGKHTFEMKSNGGYVTTIPVVPYCGDSYEMVDGIIYKYFASNPSKVTPNLKITMVSDTEIEVYSYQTKDTYTLYKRR